MKRMLALVAVALLATSCGALGREYPTCDFTFFDVPGSIVMEAQALPEAAFGPCLHDLEPGWEYHHMQHESGRVHFWLDSDRIGDRFVEVTMTDSCDVRGAVAGPSPEPSIERFIVTDEGFHPIKVVIVPLTEAAHHYAASVGVDLAGVSVRGRPLQLELAAVGSPETNIREALTDGAFVIAADDTDMRQRTVQVRVPVAGEIDADLELDDAIERITHNVEEGSYEATWYHVFEGGCVTFEFDAEGQGVETLLHDVDSTIGFTDLAALRARAEEEGIFLDE